MSQSLHSCSISIPEWPLFWVSYIFTSLHITLEVLGNSWSPPEKPCLWTCLSTSCYDVTLPDFLKSATDLEVFSCDDWFLLLFSRFFFLPLLIKIPCGKKLSLKEGDKTKFHHVLSLFSLMQQHIYLLVMDSCTLKEQHKIPAVIPRAISFIIPTDVIHMRNLALAWKFLDNVSKESLLSVLLQPLNALLLSLSKLKFRNNQQFF